MGIVLLGVAAYWLHFLFFPSADDYAAMIAGADRLELRIFFEGNEEGGTTVASIEDPQIMHELADSIAIDSIWLPLDVLIGNSYCIRTFRNDHSADIIIRGFGRIQHGNWYARVSPKVLTLFVEIVQKEGIDLSETWRSMINYPQDQGSDDGGPS